MWDAVMHSDRHSDRHSASEACDLAARHSGRLRAPNPRPAPDSDSWLGAVLDEVDYAMLLVGPGHALLHANAAARSGLDRGGPLQLRDGRIAASRAADEAALARALVDASQRGMRCMLALGEGLAQVRVAVVPLDLSMPGHTTATLLMLGRSSVCEELSIQCFAMSHRLTPAETQVLVCLCRGDSPASIAQRQGVALSTVRSHVVSVRAKTGTASIRALCEQIALLPPMVCALRARSAALLS